MRRRLLPVLGIASLFCGAACGESVCSPPSPAFSGLRADEAGPGIDTMISRPLLMRRPDSEKQEARREGLLPAGTVATGEFFSPVTLDVMLMPDPEQPAWVDNLVYLICGLAGISARERRAPGK